MNTTAERIQIALDIRGMRQSDLAAQTKIGKSSIHAYLSGDYLPKQNNIYKMALALNVSEAWLMGYDVPMERKSNPVEAEAEAYDAYMKSEAEKMHLTISDTDPQIDELVRNAEQLNAQGKQKLVDYSDDLLGNPVYQKQTPGGSSASEGIEDRMA